MQHRCAEQLVREKQHACLAVSQGWKSENCSRMQWWNSPVCWFQTKRLPDFRANRPVRAFLEPRTPTVRPAERSSVAASSRGPTQRAHRDPPEPARVERGAGRKRCNFWRPSRRRPGGKERVQFGNEICGCSHLSYFSIL